MSQEQLQPKQPDPVEQVGMTPEMQREAVRLREDIGVAADGERHAYADKHHFERAEMNGGVFAGLNLFGIAWHNAHPVVKKAQRVNAEHKATKHFRQNEAAYVEQAEEEASESGIELNR